MLKLPGNVYIEKSNQDTEILTFGKSKEVSDIDTKEGVSRFGGLMRQPSYSQAYLKAAKVLRDKAVDAEELDEFGLPIFYLVRHSVELKIKGLLEMAYDILDMTQHLYPERITTGAQPSNGERRRLKKCHDLDALLRDLKKSCSSLELEIPEKQFSGVLDLILEYEIDPTWSRYSKSDKGSHVLEEVVLPIVQITENTEKLFDVLSYNQPDDFESLESELYFMFSSLTSKTKE
jgi:hypothetical protein